MAIEPRNPEPGLSIADRAQNLVPWVLTLLFALPLAALSLLVGALVADPLEAAGVPHAVAFPLGLLAMAATLAIGAILVFRRLWSRSPAARRREARAEAHRSWLHDLDARLAPHGGPAKQPGPGPSSSGGPT